MKLGTVPQAIASGAAVLLISACAAGIGVGAEPLEQAQAATPASDSPPCGYDVYRGKVYVTSLSVNGTARVIKWKNGIGTDLGHKRIKKGQTVTVSAKHVKPARITVDIVKGKLSKNDTRNGWKRVRVCEPA